MVELHPNLVLLGEVLATSGVVAILGSKTFEHVVAAETAGTVEHVAGLAPWGQHLIAGKLGRQGVYRA